jgi:16S rRNA (guanine527-N7)-methyltransferase
VNRGPLLEVLERARDRGFLGPGEVSRHLDHSLGFAEVARSVLGAPPTRLADLGTGGGVPGLVLAVAWPETDIVLVESSVRRADALRADAEALGLDRVRVLEGRAEEQAHDRECREQFDLVTARSFGPPPVTAEIAAGFVSVGGIVLVSEPPGPHDRGTGDRWPEAPLEGLGLDPPHFSTARGAHYVWLRKTRPTPADRPRQRGRAAKRPLW